MIDTGTEQRIATVKRTGERYLVQQINIDRGQVYTWQAVTGLGYGPKKKTLQIEGSQTFSRDSVHIETVHLSEGLALDLFEQYHLFRRDDLMSGDYEIVKSGNNVRRIRKSQLGAHHATLKCPCHGTNMRICKATKGGSFWGCPTKGETGCRITFSTDEYDSNGNLRMSDPDGMVKGREQSDMAAE
jgi:hypothetical protein